MLKRAREALRKTAAKIALASLAALIAACAAWIASSSISRAEEEKRRLAAFDNLTANVIERIAELAVLEYRYTDVMELQRKFVIGGQSSSLVRFSGVVKAGIADVSAVEAAWDRKSDTVRIKLPRTSILSNDVDIGSLRIWDLKRNLFVPISTDLKLQEVAAFRDKVASELEASGFLHDADSRVADVVAPIFAGFATTIQTEFIKN